MSVSIRSQWIGAAIVVVGLPVVVSPAQARGDTPADWAASICNSSNPGSNVNGPDGTGTFLRVPSAQAPLINASSSGTCTLYDNSGEGGCNKSIFFTLGSYTSDALRGIDIANRGFKGYQVLAYATKSDNSGSWLIVALPCGAKPWTPPPEVVANARTDLASLQRYGFTVSS